MVCCLTRYLTHIFSLEYRDGVQGGFLLSSSFMLVSAIIGAVPYENKAEHRMVQLIPSTQCRWARSEVFIPKAEWLSFLPQLPWAPTTTAVVHRHHSCWSSEGAPGACGLETQGSESMPPHLLIPVTLSCMHPLTRDMPENYKCSHVFMEKLFFKAPPSKRATVLNQWGLFTRR